MNIEIEQLKKLQAGKTYYIRLPEGTPQDAAKAFSKNIDDLDLNCMIIVGIGEFDIVDISDQII